MSSSKEDDNKNKNKNRHDHQHYSSRLLIWPKGIIRRSRMQPAGWVLGWKSVPTPGRQTVLCAGILPQNTSLQDYLARVQTIRQQFSTKSTTCGCLTQSLEIVAYWCGGGGCGTKNPQKANDNGSTKKNLVLPKITMQQGHPWWWEEETVDPQQQHRQILYYEPQDPQSFSHFASVFGMSGNHNNHWPILLHQLNHSQEMLAMVQNGMNLLQVVVSTRPKEETPDCNDDEETTIPQITKNSRLSSIKSMMMLLCQSSLTLLHFRQLVVLGQERRLAILSFIPWIRCLQNLPNSRSTILLLLSKDTCCCCSCCGKSSVVPSRPLGAKRLVHEWDQFLSAAIDAVLGLLVAIVLLIIATKFPSVGLYSIQAKHACFQMLKENVAWLETFPAGFKLNVQWTHTMGQEIRNLLFFHQHWLDATLWNPQMVSRILVWLASLAAMSGWTGFLVLMMDLWRLEMVLVIWVFHVGFRYLYRAELYLLGAFWRLFRGKKRNVLRQRTDSMQYDATQLLVGTILFCICIFLWTTIWAYYTFFVVANILFHLPLLILWLLYMTNRSVPLGGLVWRTKEPMWFSKTVHLQMIQERENDVRVTRLCSNAESHVTLVSSHLLLHLKPVIQWWMNFCLEALIPRNSNEAPCFMPLTTFLESFIYE